MNQVRPHRRRLSVRTLLTLLVLVMVVPAAGIIAWLLAGRAECAECELIARLPDGAPRSIMSCSLP